MTSKILVWTLDQPEQLSEVLTPLCHRHNVEISIHRSGVIPDAEGFAVLVVMGTKTLAVLQSLGIAPKNRTIASLRYPTVFKLGTIDTIVTYSSEVAGRDYGWYVNLILDFNQAIRRAKTGSFSPTLGNYRYVETFSEAIATIKAQYEKTGIPVPVALDTETVGLDPYALGGWIVSIQLAYQQEAADVVTFSNSAVEFEALNNPTLLRGQLDWLLTTEMINHRGANFKYDLHWLWSRAALKCTNFTLDTMLVGSLIDENRGNSLNLHTKWYCPELGGYDDALNRTYDKSRMDLVPKKDLLPYAAGDADAALRVSECMKKELLNDTRLASFYIQLLHPAARAFEIVERTGLHLDVPYYLELEFEIKAEMARLEKEAAAIIGGRLIAKHGGVSLTKSALISDYMFGPIGLRLKPKMRTPKTKVPSTSIEHLEMFADDPRAKAFVEIVRAWSSANKTLSVYVCKRDDYGVITGGFLHHLRSDGLLHPTYFLFNSGADGGTNTGRLSARDPAIQTLAKRTFWAKKLRKAFIAPPGHVLLSNDYSQGELKIAACLANEVTMIAAYMQGIDLHAVTAARLSGYSLQEFLALKETDSEKFENIRYLGKAGNFGLLYGMMPQGFQNYAQTSYGLDMGLEEAQAAREKFFALYPRLTVWHEKAKAEARKTLAIRSPLGRVRHLPLITSRDREAATKAERQSLNAPVQATLSDMSLWATAIMHQNGWFDESPVVAMIHDQLISYVPEQWEPYAKRNKHVMENLPFHKLGWKPQLQFTVDAEVGLNLGEMQKVSIS